MSERIMAACGNDCALADRKDVDDLCLHICPGEIYGFIGHNGAGKTTTLKSIVGILAFDEGTME